MVKGDKDTKIFTESSSLRKNIMTELIEPSYYTDIKEMLEDRKYWRHVGDNFSTISKIFVGLSGVFSFASGNYQNVNFSFIAGTISILSLVCLQFSSYSIKESKRKTEELNNILSKLNISTIPIFEKNTEYDKIENKDDDEKYEKDDKDTKDKVEV